MEMYEQDVFGFSKTNVPTLCNELIALQLIECNSNFRHLVLLVTFKFVFPTEAF